MVYLYSSLDLIIVWRRVDKDIYDTKCGIAPFHVHVQAVHFNNTLLTVSLLIKSYKIKEDLSWLSDRIGFAQWNADMYFKFKDEEKVPVAYENSNYCVL